MEHFSNRLSENGQADRLVLSQAAAPGAAYSYLSLLRRCLCRYLFPDGRYGDDMQPLPFDPEMRENGKDWPTEAETMAGMKRLQNLQDCCFMSIAERIEGDFVETGVWRGGCGILMRAVLEATADETRKVWLFDSFQGLPKPDPNLFPLDKGDRLWTYSYLKVGLDQVQANFSRYELLDGRTRFVPGWFRDTIPNAAVDKISVLRLDGDMYESTWQVLAGLYPKVSTGGFVIIDDYGAIDACKQGVDDFRAKYDVQSPLNVIDWTGIFWRKCD